MNDIEDDESTVSFFDNYISEINVAAPVRGSFQSSTTNDGDDSTVSTVASTIHDDQGNTWNDDVFDCFDDLSLQDDDECSEQKVKRVTFGKSVVREYGVTVGTCTPANTGRCPMELTWEYAESYAIESYRDELITIGQRKKRPLSVKERRDRIATVQGISTDDVLILEYEASIALIQETLEFLESTRHKLLYSMESPLQSKYTDNFSYQNKQIIGESNKFLRKLMIEEISFNPL